MNYIVFCRLHESTTDLLEACNAFVNSFYSDDRKTVKTRLHEALKRAQAAIRKAEGV